MKDDIVQQSFIQPAQYKRSSASDKDAVRGAYLSGQAQVEYLHLRFESFNEQFFESLMKLKLEDDRAHADKQAEKQAKRKQVAMSQKEQRAKRHCVGLLLWKVSSRNEKQLDWKEPYIS